MGELTPILSGFSLLSNGIKGTGKIYEVRVGTVQQVDDSIIHTCVRLVAGLVQVSLVAQGGSEPDSPVTFMTCDVRAACLKSVRHTQFFSITPVSFPATDSGLRCAARY